MKRRAALISALVILMAGLAGGLWALARKTDSPRRASAPAGTGSSAGAAAQGGVKPKNPGTVVPPAAAGGADRGLGSMQVTEPGSRAADASGGPSLPPTGAAQAGLASGRDTLASSGVRGKAAGAALILKSSPPFAEAYVDGRFVGNTPVRIDPIVPGAHRLAMKSARLPGFDTTVVVRPGIQALKVHLEEGQALRMAATPVEGD